MHIEEVAEVGRESRCIRTTFGGEALHLSFDIGRIDGSLQRTILVCGKIETSILGIVAIEIAHLIVALGDLTHELSVEGVPIEVLITALFGKHGEVSRIELQIGVG